MNAILASKISWFDSLYEKTDTPVNFVMAFSFLRQGDSKGYFFQSELHFSKLFVLYNESINV